MLRRLRRRLARWLRVTSDWMVRASEAVADDHPYPDAPGHWLRMVRRRAPQLLAGRGVGGRVTAPSGPPWADPPAPQPAPRPSLSGRWVGAPPPTAEVAAPAAGHGGWRPAPSPARPDRGHRDGAPLVASREVAPIVPGRAVGTADRDGGARSARPADAPRAGSHPAGGARPGPPAWRERVRQGLRRSPRPAGSATPGMPGRWMATASTTGPPPLAPLPPIGSQWSPLPSQPRTVPATGGAAVRRLPNPVPVAGQPSGSDGDGIGVDGSPSPPWVVSGAIVTAGGDWRAHRGPWPDLPDDETLWTSSVPAFPPDQIRRLDDEQRGRPLSWRE